MIYCGFMQNHKCDILFGNNFLTLLPGVKLYAFVMDSFKYARKLDS